MVVAERTISWDGTSDRRGLATFLGATSTGSDWVFPEGLVEDGVVEDLLILNPSERDTAVEIQPRLDGDAVDFAESREEPVLVHLAGREREREVITEAQELRGIVAQTREIAHSLAHFGADLLRRFPRAPSLLGVVAAAKHVEDRVVIDARAVDLTDSVVLLKGARTLIGAPTEFPVVNVAGTPALATAGAGDVLTGIISALAVTLEPRVAAYCGAHLHALAAERCTTCGTPAGIVARYSPGVPNQRT